MTSDQAMEILRGSLWHTTTEARWEGIRAAGAILVEPPVPDGERHGTAIGPSGYPYARSLGGVSLFDFADFDYEAYKRNCHVDHVARFVPVYSAWHGAVWIEIDRSGVSTSLLSARDLEARRKREQAYGHRLIGSVEGAHIGNVPRTAFIRILLVRRGEREFQTIA